MICVWALCPGGVARPASQPRQPVCKRRAFSARCQMGENLHGNTPAIYARPRRHDLFPRIPIAVIELPHDHEHPPEQHPGLAVGPFVLGACPCWCVQWCALS